MEHWLATHRPAPQESAQFCAAIADALEHAHQHGVVHRDLKPSNVIVDVSGRPHVTDFGLARRDADVTMTLDGRLLGTPAYMSPEQARGQGHQADARADVYSLGVILYEMLTGERPFRGSVRMILQQVLTTDAVRPRTLKSHIPKDLETICMKCLEKDPRQRFQSAGDLRDEFLRIVRGEPVLARPVSKSIRCWRWCLRNKRLAATLLVLQLVTIVGFIGVLSQWQIANEQRKQSDRLKLEAETERDAATWESYRANIAAAVAAFELYDLQTLRRSLRMAPVEFRGWEWHYLHGRADRSLLALPGDKHMPSRVGFTHGGQIAVMDFFRTQLWDRRTLKPIEQLPMLLSQGTSQFLYRGEHQGPAGSVLSPDGSRIARRSKDGTLTLLDAATSNELSVLWSDTPAYVLPTFSNNGDHVASWCGDGHVRVWNARTGMERVMLSGEQVSVTSLMFSPDGTRLVTWEVHDKHNWPPENVCLWDCATGDLLVSFVESDPVKVAEVAFSQDGKLLAIGRDYPSSHIAIWDASAAEKLGNLNGHENRVWSIDFSPDDSRLVSASMDQTMRLWDVANRQEIAQQHGHEGSIAQVKFSPDGSRLASVSDDGTVRLWDGRTGQFSAALLGHTRPVAHLAFSPDGAIVLTGAYDGTVRVWDLEAADKTVFRGHESFVYDVAVSPNGRHAATASWDRTVRIWDLTSGQQMNLIQADAGTPLGIAYSHDGSKIAFICENNSLQIWDVKQSKPLHKLSLPITSLLGATNVRPAFNINSTHVAAGAGDGTVHIWHVETAESVAVVQGHQGPVTDVQFSPDGLRLATVGGSTVRLWDAVTYEPLQVLRGHTAEPIAVAFSTDSQLIASAGFDSETAVRLWDVATGRQRAVLQHGVRVYSVAFSRDGSRLSTACDDNKIRIWSVAEAQEVAVLNGHTAYVHAVAFTPDGTRLISASGDKTVRVWDQVSQRVRLHPPPGRRAPNHYLCHRAAAPVKVDGQLDDDTWKEAAWTQPFVDIQGDMRPPPRYLTRVKMLWDDQYFYVAAELRDPHVWGTLKKHDSVIFQDNDFEVFIDPDGDQLRYAELEINALGTTWDLLLPKPYRDGGQAQNDWEIPGLKKAVHVVGTLNDPGDTDDGWTVELAFPWTAFAGLSEQPLPPQDGDQWRINFSRVQWPHITVNGNYEKLPEASEDNWVWSPQWAVDMHQPEYWGYVQFCIPASGRATFRPDRDSWPGE